MNECLPNEMENFLHDKHGAVDKGLVNSWLARYNLYPLFIGHQNLHLIQENKILIMKLCLSLN